MEEIIKSWKENALKNEDKSQLNKMTDWPST